MREIYVGRQKFRMNRFSLAVLQEAAGAGKFDTSQSKTDTPTLWLDIINGIDITTVAAWLTHTNYPRGGVIQRIHYRIKAANAVTFTLRIWRAAIDANYESNMTLLYESPALQASDTDYDRAELSIPFFGGTIYYSLEWTGATGNVNGFIEISGETTE